MTAYKLYKCPNCKHSMSLRSTDFVKGIVIVSCADCGRDAFAIEDSILGL